MSLVVCAVCALNGASAVLDKRAHWWGWKKELCLGIRDFDGRAIYGWRNEGWGIGLGVRLGISMCLHASVENIGSFRADCCVVCALNVCQRRVR